MSFYISQDKDMQIIALALKIIFAILLYVSPSDKPVNRSDGTGRFIDFEEEDFEPDNDFDIEEIKRKQDKEFDLGGMTMASSKEKNKAKVKGKKEDKVKGQRILHLNLWVKPFLDDFDLSE